MTIIDRYLLRQFLQVFAICFCSLNGIYIIFDGFGNLDEFLRHANQGGNLLAIMGEYYSFQSIYFFDRLSSVLTMMAAMFTVTWLRRHQELTALEAAGISKWRLIAPLAVAAAVISLGSAFSREFVIPSIRDELSRTPADLRGAEAQEVEPVFDHRTDILFKGQKSFAHEKRISRPSLMLPPDLDVYGNQLIAENAYFKTADQNHPAGYLLTRVSQPTDLSSRASLSAGELPVIITPQDATGWLKPGECFVVSDLSFEHLTGSKNWRRFSSTFEMIRGLSSPSLDLGADVRVAIHARLIQPLLDFTLVFLGLPLVLGRENRNIFAAVGQCVLLVGMFMIVSIGCSSLGADYILSASLAAWLPLMLFLPLAVYLSGAISR